MLDGMRLDRRDDSYEHILSVNIYEYVIQTCHVPNEH